MFCLRAEMRKHLNRSKLTALNTGLKVHVNVLSISLKLLRGSLADAMLKVDFRCITHLKAIPRTVRWTFVKAICVSKNDLTSRPGNLKHSFLLVLPSFSSLHKKEVGRVLLRGQFWRKKKIRRFSKPKGRRTKILSL